MAADTAAKRLSAMNMMCPWRGNAVVPSGTVDANERAAVLLLYSGIPGGAEAGGGGGPGAKRGGLLVNIGSMMG